MVSVKEVYSGIVSIDQIINDNLLTATFGIFSRVTFAFESTHELLYVVSPFPVLIIFRSPQHCDSSSFDFPNRGWLMMM